MYHAIGRGDRTVVTLERFAGHMRWLREESGLSVAPLMDAVAAIPRLGTAVALTFDDGDRSVLERAVPVLARHGLPCTVFVIGDHLRRPLASDRYLDVSALRELAAVPGVSIGAHGATHRPLPALDDVRLDEELRRSVEALSDVLGRRPAVMSYPHGAVDRRVVSFVARAGFEAAATSLLGVNRPRTARLRLRRTEIDTFDDTRRFSGKVHGDYDWYQLKQRLYWPALPVETGRG